MQRVHLYLKVVIEAEDDDSPEKLGREVCRQAARVYGVRETEIQNVTVEKRDGPADEDE
jgi:hypothetical protein